MTPRKPALQPADPVTQRWRDLRKMLTRQLDMFEGGALTLRSDNQDVSPRAIVDLKTRILEFDTLIAAGRRG